MNLLSVDMDTFFELPSDESQDWQFFDWAARDNEFFSTRLWEHRACDFLVQDRSVPGTTGEEIGFWERVRIKKTATLYYADSHALAASREVTRDGKRHFGRVVSVDAHHDCGYEQRTTQESEAGKFHCDTWLRYYQLTGAHCTLVYPSWRGESGPVEVPPIHEPDVTTSMSELNWDTLPVFDHVFLARSGPWFPAWLEDSFWRLLGQAPVKTKIDLQGVTRRQFNLDEAEKQADRMRTVMGGGEQ